MNLEINMVQITVTIVALIAGGFSKGVTGLGLPMIITPPLAWIFGIQTAVPLVAIPTVISNIFFIGKYRHAWREVLRIWPMVVSGLVAIIGGVLFLQHTNQSITAVILAILAIAYVALNFSGHQLKIAPERLPVFGPLLGIVAGFFHGTTGVSGPPVIAYLSSIEELSRDAYFQALGFIFFLFGLQQVSGYVVSGVYTRDILLMGLLAAVPVMVSFYLGTWFQAKLDAEKFKTATLILILLSSVNLLANNVPALLT